MKFKQGIIGVFQLLWERRKHNSFYDVFQDDNTSEEQCDVIYRNLRKTWIRTVMMCLIVIGCVWGVYYINRGMIAMSISTLVTLILVGIPIALWFCFNAIERGINKHVTEIRRISKSPIKKGSYDDFDLGI